MHDSQFDDIAYVQNEAFSQVADHAKDFILNLFQHNTSKKGLVVDLGCGTGQLLKTMAKNGYKTLGIDYSDGAIKIAKNALPSGSFICGSIYDANIPSCQYITASDITLNYIPEKKDPYQLLNNLFKKIYQSLESGGLFVFDIQIICDDMPKRDKLAFIDNPEWSIFIKRTENRHQNIITREITLFFKTGYLYKKTQQTQITRSLNLQKILSMLTDIQFSVETFHQYGSLKFTPDQVGIIAKK